MSSKSNSNGRTRASSVSVTEVNSTQPGLSSIFLIDVEPGKKAYRYDVEILACDRPSKSFNLTKGSADLNRRISAELVGIAVKKSGLLTPPNSYVYDGRCIFYSSAELLKSGLPISISWAEVSNLVQLTFNNKTKFEVIINPCQTNNRVLNLDDLSEYEHSNDSIEQQDRSLRSFFELAIAQKAFESDEFISLGGGRLFKRLPDGAPFFLGNQITFHSGVCKGVRIVQGLGGKTQAAVVLDAKVGAFMTNQTVEKTINDFMRFNPNGWNKLHSFLRGVKVQCAYNRSRIFSIGGFGEKPFEQEGFEKVSIDGTTEWISLIDYFVNKKKIHISNLQLPGIYPMGKRSERFPAEQLIILEGQKVPQEKQTPELVEILLKKNTIFPNERHQKIRLSGRELVLWDGQNDVLAAFGMKVREESNDTIIEVRPLPHLLYKNGREIAPSGDKGDWSKTSGSFIVPAAFPSWTLLYNANDREMIVQFLEKLRLKCLEKGMRYEKPTMLAQAQKLFDEKTKLPKSEEWLGCFMHFAKANFKFLLMIDSIYYDSHGLLKLFEVFNRSTGNKLITQQVTIETVESIITKGRRQTLENIVNKLNVKFGGLNYQTLPAQLQLPELAKFEQRFNVNSGDLLIIGYDVSHPTQKIHEAKKPKICTQPSSTTTGTDDKMDIGDDDAELEPTISISSTEPSVVGICANMAENPHNFIGDYFFQTSRKEEVDLEDLTRRSKWILASLEVNRPTHKRPKYVIILRDGLSEGQYEMAYKREMKAIREGFALHDPDYSPKFVLVIGSKRHFKKFFAGNNVKAENMPPGSVIYEKVVRPDVIEFYLQSHFPIQGTGKLVEYVVLANEIEFNCKIDELKEYAKLLRYKTASQEFLEELMFKKSLYSLLMALSFNHQIVNKPISLPEPVFQADELAKRGHANYMTLKDFYPKLVPYTEERHAGQRIMDTKKLTRMLSYWGNGQLVLKNRFTA